MHYLMWMDLDAKKPPAQKIAEAALAYVNRFKARPNVALVNEADVCAVAGMDVRALARVERNTFQIGREHDNAE